MHPEAKVWAQRVRGGSSSYSSAASAVCTRTRTVPHVLRHVANAELGFPRCKRARHWNSSRFCFRLSFFLYLYALDCREGLRESFVGQIKFYAARMQFTCGSLPWGFSPLKLCKRYFNLMCNWMKLRIGMH